MPTQDLRPSNHPTAGSSKTDESKVCEIAESLELTTGRAKELEFEQLYAEHKGKVFSTAYRLVGNRPDAEDITQDVFVRVFKNMDAFRGESAISTWIYRITVNACFDLLRKRKRQPSVPLEECPEPSIGSGGLGRLIETMVRSLPEAYRKVFTLYDIQGLKHGEIAKVLGITEGASKSLLHRARAQLRKRLSPYVREWRGR